MVFFGLPFGSTLGIFTINRIFAAKNRWRKGPLVSTFFGGIAGPVLVMWIFPRFGFDIARLLPQFETYGYNVDNVLIPCASAATAVAAELLWTWISALLRKEA
jgi:hypothetical protein